MALTRSQIRSQVYALLHQSSGDTNFSDDQINAWIDEAQSLIATVVQYPRKYDSTVPAVMGTAVYALPTDWVMTLRVFFGNPAVAGDIRPLQIVSEDYLTSVAPGWLESTVGSRSRPIYFVIKDKSNFLVYPTPDLVSNGKSFYHNYVYEPPSLTSDSSSPAMPLPYQNIIKFYVAHLAYIAQANKDMANSMFNDFMAHHKQIQADSNKETKQALQWEWVDRVGLSGGGDTMGERLEF